MRKITVTLSEREQTIIREALTQYITEVSKARSMFIISDEAWWGATRDFQDEVRALYEKIVNA